MKVSELMSDSTVSVTPEESAGLASRLLSRHNIGSLPVCDEDGHVHGVITDRDIVTRCVAVGDDPEHTPVGQLMTRGVISVNPDEDVERAAELMGRGQVRRLPVTENGKLVGVISLGDIARTASCHMEAAQALEEISGNIQSR